MQWTNKRGSIELTSDIKMNFESLRLKHKEFIVERAFNIYKPSCESGKGKEWWVEFLLSGNDIHEMIRSLKENSETPVSKNIKEIERPSASSVGRVKIIDDDMEFHAEGRRKLWVHMVNHSASAWQTTPEEPLFAAYHWYDEAGNVHEFDGRRTALAKPVPPGKTLAMEVDIVNPSEPGDYQLMVTMVMEGQFWMEERSLQTQRTPLAVLEYDGDGLTRHARDLYHQLKRSVMEATQ